MTTRDINIVNLKTNGEFAKSNGNAQHSLNCNGDVTIEGSVFGQKGYNCLEIGLTSGYLPKNVTISNCQFTGHLDNNSIIVFGVQEGGVITVKDCTFEDVSNVLRFSNKANVNNVTINFENCVCKSWEKRSAGNYINVWAGWLLFEDYTSKYTSTYTYTVGSDATVKTATREHSLTKMFNAEGKAVYVKNMVVGESYWTAAASVGDESTKRTIVSLENFTDTGAYDMNLFAPSKVKVNFKNCFGPDRVVEGSTLVAVKGIKKLSPETYGDGTIASVCNTMNGNSQVVAMCYDYDVDNYMPSYDASRYPEISFI